MWLPLNFAEQKEGTETTQGILGGLVNWITQHLTGEIMPLAAKLTDPSSILETHNQRRHSSCGLSSDPRPSLK